MFARSKLVPELMVTDIKKSLHFWTSLIGFQIAYERPEVGFAYLDQNGWSIGGEFGRAAVFARQPLSQQMACYSDRDYIDHGNVFW